MKLLACTLLALAGCGSYTVPGGAADLTLFGAPRADGRASLTDPDIRSALDKRPLATLPAGLAVARVQASGYRSRSVHSWGQGAYSVVTVRDIEKDEDFDRLARLPLVRDIDEVTSLLLPASLWTGRELRQAAANLHADLLLVYTLDTRFETEDFATPLTVISLGLFPTKNARVNSTAAAVLLDTRNGYVYGTASASSRKTQLANAWTSAAAVDQSRRRAERDAFEGLLDDIERTWTRELAAHARPSDILDPTAPAGRATYRTPGP